MSRRSSKETASADSKWNSPEAQSDLVEVEVQAGPDIVCRKRGQRGINVETREDIQRELSGHGWQAGWKTQQQIEAERRLSLGRP